MQAGALVVTSDAAVLGNREWDRRNFARPRQLSFRNKLNVLAHPRWLGRVVFPSGLPLMANLEPYLPVAERSALGSMKFIGEQMDTLLDWKSWPVSATNGPGNWCSRACYIRMMQSGHCRLGSMPWWSATTAAASWMVPAAASMR